METGRGLLLCHLEALPRGGCFTFIWLRLTVVGWRMTKKKKTEIQQLNEKRGKKAAFY